MMISGECGVIMFPEPFGRKAVCADGLRIGKWWPHPSWGRGWGHLMSGPLYWGLSRSGPAYSSEVCQWVLVRYLWNLVAAIMKAKPTRIIRRIPLPPVRGRLPIGVYLYVLVVSGVCPTSFRDQSMVTVTLPGSWPGAVTLQVPSVLSTGLVPSS